MNQPPKELASVWEQHLSDIKEDYEKLDNLFLEIQKKFPNHKYFIFKDEDDLYRVGKEINLDSL